jgi:putative glycerol-1-phosphate prenyltransferase
MKTSVYEKIMQKIRSGTKLFALLIDPDRLAEEQLKPFIERVDSEVDIYLLGTSYLINHSFDSYVQTFKKYTQKPLLLFPGNLFQVSGYADAILFLSVLSGRNPEHLISTQVQAAPIIHKLHLETISLAYLLIESGRLTTAQYMNNSLPIPRKKPGIAVAHALAAQFFGFQSVYLEAGSGAEYSVPTEMISAVKSHIQIPLFVGGGIKTPEDAREKAQAGADIVVVGNHFENEENLNQLHLFSKAIHEGGN